MTENTHSIEQISQRLIRTADALQERWEDRNVILIKDKKTGNWRTLSDYAVPKVLRVFYEKWIKWQEVGQQAAANELVRQAEELSAQYAAKAEELGSRTVSHNAALKVVEITAGDNAMAEAVHQLTLIAQNQHPQINHDSDTTRIWIGERTLKEALEAVFGKFGDDKQPGSLSEARGDARRNIDRQVRALRKGAKVPFQSSWTSATQREVAKATFELMALKAADPNLKERIDNYDFGLNTLFKRLNGSKKSPKDIARQAKLIGDELAKIIELNKTYPKYDPKIIEQIEQEFESQKKEILDILTRHQSEAKQALIEAQKEVKEAQQLHDAVGNWLPNLEVKAKQALTKPLADDALIYFEAHWKEPEVLSATVVQDAKKLLGKTYNGEHVRASQILQDGIHLNQGEGHNSLMRLVTLVEVRDAIKGAESKLSQLRKQVDQSPQLDSKLLPNAKEQEKSAIQKLHEANDALITFTG